MSETESVGTRGRCRKPFLVAGPVAVALIVSGGGLAQVADAVSTDPAVEAVRWTGPDGQLVGAGGAPVTTTSLGHGGHDATETSTARDAAGVSPAGASGVSSTSADQTISVSIEPGPLTVSPSSQSVVLSGAGGATDKGDLAAVTVVDARGTLVGWTATVTLQSVSGLDTSQTAHARFCVTPQTVTVVAGRPPEVQSATGSCGNVGDPLTVFFAPPNGGGGTFSDAAGLTLQLPSGTGPDQIIASVAVAVH